MPADAPLSILYQDDAIVVVVKPSGLLCAPGKGAEKLDSITHRFRQHFPDSPSFPAPHRLDMDTSGLMLLCRTRDALRALSRQFQERLVAKEYTALIRQAPPQDAGRITLPFRLDPDDRPRQVYDPEQGKLGITEWQVLERHPDHCRLLLRPLTGRTHQLRVHAAHPLGLDSPILGDPLYGDATSHGQLKLHASKIGFTHPLSEVWVEFEAEAPF